MATTIKTYKITSISRATTNAVPMKNECYLYYNALRFTIGLDNTNQAMDCEVTYDFSELNDASVNLVKGARELLIKNQDNPTLYVGEYNNSPVIQLINNGTTVLSTFDLSKIKDFTDAVIEKGRVTFRRKEENGITHISHVFYYPNEDLNWKLRVNRKNVKMFHNSTGKNYKTFTIDGHTFDFRTELTPAQDLGVLQTYIDGLDWTHLVLTGIKKYPANSLVWGDLTGEPSLYTNVAITSITHAEIGASGTYPVTFNFTRTKTDGTTDTATKVVNVVATITLPKPASIVWYGDNLGNVYKDGVKTYSHSGEQITAIISKGNDVWYATQNGIVFKNGTILHDKEYQRDKEIFDVALDVSGNLYYSMGNYDKVLKNGNHFLTSQSSVPLKIKLDKSGNLFFINDHRLFKTTSAGGSASTIISGGDPFRDFTILKSGEIVVADGRFLWWNSDSNTKNLPFTKTFTNKDGFFYGMTSDLKIKKMSSLNSTPIELIANNTFDPNGNILIDINENIFWSTSDKKIIKSTNTNGTYLEPVVLYTTEGANPVVCVSTEYGSRTGIWE